MSFASFSTFVSEQRLLICQLEYFRQEYVRLVPLKHQESVRLQNTEALTEAGAEHLSPIFAEVTILDHLPTLGFFLGARILKVWRVKDNSKEGAVIVWHTREVSAHIWAHLEFTSIAESSFYRPYILKKNPRVLLVEVKHLAAAASIKDILHVIL